MRRMTSTMVPFRNRPSPWLAAILAAPFVLAAARHAGAEAEPSPVEEELPDGEAARAGFEKGIAHYKAGAYDDALKEFKEAFDAKPHWKIRYNIGLCYYKLGLWTQAMTELTLMLEEGVDKVSAQQAKKVQAVIDVLAGKVAKLTLKGDFEGAEIIIDGEPVLGLADGSSLFLNPGEHRVDASVSGALAFSESVLITGGQVKVVKIKLKPQKIPKAEKEEPKPVVKTPAKKKDMKKMKIVAGAILAAAAGAALAGGGGAGLAALLEKQKQEDVRADYMLKYEQDEAEESDYQKAKRDMDRAYGRAQDEALASTILFAVAGALALGSLIAFVVPVEKKHEGQGIEAALAIDPAAGAMALLIAF
jgi:tetratricopeptide (TPR) repeat protein